MLLSQPHYAVPIIEIVELQYCTDSVPQLKTLPNYYQIVPINYHKYPFCH